MIIGASEHVFIIIHYFEKFNNNTLARTCFYSFEKFNSNKHARTYLQAKNKQAIHDIY